MPTDPLYLYDLNSDLSAELSRQRKLADFANTHSRPVTYLRAKNGLIEGLTEVVESLRQINPRTPPNNTINYLRQRSNQHMEEYLTHPAAVFLSGDYYAGLTEAFEYAANLLEEYLASAAQC